MALFFTPVKLDTVSFFIAEYALPFEKAIDNGSLVLYIQHIIIESQVVEIPAA